MSDDFYIGYRKEAPPALARFVRGITLSIVAIVVAIAAVIGALQQPAGDGKYDFGGKTKFEARVAIDPIPHAILDGAPRFNAGAVLVGTGKHGVPDAFRAADGKHVTFTGANESRGYLRMIEVGSNAELIVTGDADKFISHGIVIPGTFEGELIDTKCYLGVMNPAEGKVHRGCAALCLHGGVPPGLLIRDAKGGSLPIFLIAKPGAINPDWAGRILRVSGAIVTIAGIPILRAESIALR